MRSELKITDLRTAVVGRAPMTCPILRIDTNQGIYGLGEVRDGASKTYALMLKGRLLGENPLDVERLIRKIGQFGHHGRQGGGVSGIEMALWDIAGKYYSVPVYQLLGGQYRDRIRIYADTEMSQDPQVTGERLKRRIEQGFTFLKMDLGIGLLQKIPGALTSPGGITAESWREVYRTQHMFTGIELTEKGIQILVDHVAKIRSVIGMDVPLAADHFGHVGVNSCIRLGKSLEQSNLAWLEDLIPWQHTSLWKRITDSVDLPTCTGEDIYGKEAFETLCREHAVDIIHPDLATAGGILETKRIGDMAQGYGVPMAMHFAGTPVSCMANVHCAAATENVLALENHSVDVEWWDGLVEGVEKPIVNRGFIAVPDSPGLGITLNDDAVQERLAEPGCFEPTPAWDSERSWDRLWS